MGGARGIGAGLCAVGSAAVGESGASAKTSAGLAHQRPVELGSSIGRVRLDAGCLARVVPQ
ncbi:MAG TPA: hypothetical protein VLU24_09985, partial [Mycobacterium sp.]|nr:hypothetical protein [Mycobacterium sp.]